MTEDSVPNPTLAKPRTDAVHDSVAPPPVLELDVKWSRDKFDLCVSQTLPLAGVTAVFGPSGGGKTTLLRVIAGFEQAQGRVVFDGEPWAGEGQWVLPQDRGVGFVFQDAGLFAHLTVAGNLRFANKRAAHVVPQRYELAEVIQAFALHDLLDRSVNQLSGGERQRVALARMLLTRPRLMVLDEPLAGLDHARKAEILPFLETLIQRFNIPTLYVSHDVDEVARFADHMLVLGAGRVHAYGATAEVLQRLDLLALTGRFDASTLLEGVVTRVDSEYQLVHVALSDDPAAQRLMLPWTDAAAPTIGQRLTLRIRTRDVSLAKGDSPPTGLSIRNIVASMLLDVQSTPDTPFVEVLLQVDQQRMRARITRAAVAELALAPGQPVYALIKSVTFEAVD